MDDGPAGPTPGPPRASRASAQVDGGAAVAFVRSAHGAVVLAASTPIAPVALASPVVSAEPFVVAVPAESLQAVWAPSVAARFSSWTLQWSV